MTMTNLSQAVPEPAPLPQEQGENDFKPYASINWGYGPGKPVVIVRGVNKQGNKYRVLEGSNKARGFYYHNGDNSFVYLNPDHSQYHEDRKGQWKLTLPNGRIIRGTKPKGRGIGKKRGSRKPPVLATPQPLISAAVVVQPAQEVKEGEEQDT